MYQQLNDKKNGIRAIAILILITFVCLVPFIKKAVHVDDPMYIWAAKHIQTNPLNPYGFNVNWYFTSQPMYDVMQNPPLASYYMALLASIFGWNEIALHSAFILPAILFIIGTYLLAAYFCSRPFDAALITLFTPVVLLSSTTLMCDIMMLCFWVWGTFLWMKGVLENKKSLLLIAAVLVGCAALTKYFGMSLILLLLVWTIAKKRRVESSLVILLIPVVMLAAYEWTTSLLYGRGLLFAAAEFTKQTRNITNNIFSNLLIGAAFSGGCLFTVIFYTHRLWKKSWLLIEGMIVVAIAMAIIYLGGVGNVIINGPDGTRWGFVIQFSLFTFAGINLLAITIIDMIHNKDANSLLLTLWVFGTFLFATQINWTINGRILLPLAPVIGILIVRRMDMRSDSLRVSTTLSKSAARKQNKRDKRDVPSSSNHKLIHYLPLVPAALLALFATYADYNLANTIRQDAENISSRYKSASNTVWFEGHWGFQYYMELHGSKSLDFQNPSIAPSDFVVQPFNNVGLVTPNSSMASIRAELNSPTLSWFSCMNIFAGAGFYCDKLGPMPFLFGAIPPERYVIYSARETIRSQ